MLIPKKGEVRKPSRTISGITPVAVMLPPRKCEHGMCVYCPNLNVPQSYTPKSPVVMRAKLVNYNAFKQVQGRLQAFKAMHHPVDKIELIIMGGTFLEYPSKFQEDFIKNCYDGLNNKISKNLEEAKKINEKSNHRCVALCIETRPDKCIQFIDKMRKWGATRVELGVQIIDDKIYKLVNRGHTTKEVIEATKALKNAGFKVGYHIMPGLPGSNPKKDLKLFKKLFSDENFKPDQLKLYPCQVMPGSELENWYWKKKYKPYTKKQTEEILIEMLKNTPRYCRVMRVMREIPPEYIIAGTTRIDLRAEIEKKLRKNKIKLKEIRYREIGFALRDALRKKKKINLDLKLKITKYKASGGKEFFLEIVNSGTKSQVSSLKQERNKEDILFGLLRLRIYPKEALSCPPLPRKSKLKEKSAIIRELHVYGKALKIGQKLKIASQHQGLGKWLMKEAEKIVKEQNIKELKVISGVGVREYYKKLGYKLEKEKGEYMVKKIK
ncbi:tRNA uridine(34) 5-carboxymethylaminomethyl modification radical SAM/GNAT enzyme Elp3 [Candidatus Pacearchaeota archaeon]|nr:MAG: tRNA uridine(34) 5-carboxymethylaminomethyl modification radical SAM/GNAT enzyme Elp3 [Candidatus Pacearchaeota archaeon]